MNIAIFTDDFLPRYDGTSHVIDSLSCEFVNSGHNVLVIAADYGKDLNEFDESLPYEVLRLKSKKQTLGHGHYIVKRKWLRKYTKLSLIAFEPDIVVSFTPNRVGYKGIKYAHKFHIPSILEIDTKFSFVFNNDIPFSDRNLIHKIIFKIVLRKNTIPQSIKKANELITVSENTYYEEIEKKYHIKRSHVCIRNGVEKEDIPECTPPPHTELNDKVLKMIYVGRIVKVKNLDFSFGVCKLLKKQGVNFTFSLAGDGEDMEYFKKLADKENISDRVKFLGLKTKEELKTIYENSDLMLFPSVYDNDSIACLESRMYGIPTLTIENTATAERIKQGVNGFVIKDNINEFANVIKGLAKLKVQDKKRFNELKLSTLELKPDTWAVVAKRYLDLFTFITEVAETNLEAVLEV